MDVLILADDLSGACDCAGAAGGGGIVLLSPGLAHQPARVVAVDLDTRAVAAAEAAARTVAAARALYRPPTRLYVKIDSTLRGNWAATVAALHGAPVGEGPPPLMIVCPALPEAGRTVLDGQLNVAGVPLGQTAFAGGRADAGDLAGALAARGLTVADVALAKDAETLRREMDARAAAGATALVCDAVSRADLEGIAQASLTLDRPCVWVGSAGLMGALARALELPGSGSSETPALAGSGPVLIVVGSAAPVSHGQVERLVEQGIGRVAIEAATLRSGAVHQARASVAAELAAGRHVALTIARGETTDLADGAALAAALGSLAAPLVGAAGGLVLTGGETARAVLGRAGVTGIRLVGAVEAAVPLGITVGAFSKPVVTKAGAFGDADTLVRAVSRLAPAAPLPL